MTTEPVVLITPNEVRLSERRRREHRERWHLHAGELIEQIERFGFEPEWSAEIRVIIGSADDDNFIDYPATYTTGELLSMLRQHPADRAVVVAAGEHESGVADALLLDDVKHGATRIDFYVAG